MKNHRVDNAGGMAGMVARGIGWHGAVWCWRGADGSVETFRAWMPVFQVALAAVLLGGVGLFAWDPGVVRSLGGVLALWGAVLLLGSVWTAGAIAASVPSPRRHTPVDARFVPGDEDALVPIAPGVDVVSRPLVFHGAPFGTRMTVLDTGAGLIVYSPVAWTRALDEQVRARGEVKWIVAPNPLHHLFVEGWVEAFADAELWVAPGLAARQPHLSSARVLEAGAPAPWPGDEVVVEVVGGHPSHVEVVLCHRPSRTVVLSDLVENLGVGPEGWSWLQRWMLDLFMMRSRPGPPTDWKLTVTDRAMLRGAIERCLAWEPVSVVLAHGPIIQEDGDQVLRDAFAFVLREDHG